MVQADPYHRFGGKQAFNARVREALHRKPPGLTSTRRG